MFNRTTIAAVMVLAVLSLIGVNASAATYTWDTTSGDGIVVPGSGTWGVDSFWTTDGSTLSAWSSANDAVFAGAFVSSTTIGISGMTANSVTFNSDLSNMQLGVLANSLTINGGGITANASLTIGSQIALGASQSWNVAGGSTLTASGTISGSNTLTKTGEGTLTLTTANTFSGGLVVSSGTVNASNLRALGSGSVTNNGVLNLLVNSGTYTGLSTGLSGSGTVNLGNVGMGSNTVMINGNYSGFSGVWNLSGTAAGAGKVQMNGADNGSATINMLSNATLYVSVSTTKNATIYLNGGDTGESLGQLRLEGSATWAGSVILAGAITGAGDSSVGGNGPGYITGAISEINGSHALSKGGSSTLVISNPLNSYSGGTVVNAGTLQATAVGALGSTSGAVTMNAGTLDLGALTHTVGAVSMTAASTIQNGGLTATSYAVSNTTGTATVSANLGGGSAGLTKSGSGFLTLSGTNTYGGNTTISGGVVTLSTTDSLPGWDAAGRYTVGSGASLVVPNAITDANVTTMLGTGNFNSGSNIGFDTTLASRTSSIVLADGAGSSVRGLTKTGTNALVLNQANTYTGSTLLYSGTVSLAGAETLGVSGPLGNGGTIIFAGGYLQHTAANTSDYSSRFSTVEGQAFNVDTNGQSVTWATGLSGTAGTLTKNGAGTLTLGASSALKTITLNGGTLDLGADIILSNGGSNGIVGTGGTINATGGGRIVLASGAAGNYQDWGGTTTINAQIVESGGSYGIDVYNPSGTITLTNKNNSFTGSVRLTGVALSTNQIGMAGVNSILGRSSSIAFGNAGTAGKLIYTGTGETTDKVLVLTGTTAGAIIDQSGSGLLKFTGNVVLSSTHARTLTLQGSGTGEFAGSIPNSAGGISLSKTGAGTWTLSGVNTYGGSTNITGGTLIMANTNAATSSVILNAGTNTTLIVTNAAAIGSGEIRLNTGVTTPSVQFHIDGSAGGGIIAMPNAIASNSSIVTTFDVNNNGGTGSNNVIQLNGPAASGIGTVTWNVTGGNGYSLYIANFKNTAGSAGITTFNPTTAALSLGAITATQASGTNTYVLGGTNQYNSITGVIGDGGLGAKAALSKTNSSTWMLTGANTYTAGTSISGGTLIVTNAAGLGAGTGNNVSVAAGSSLRYVAAADAPLAVNGNLAITGGTGTTIGASIGSTATSAQINVTGTASITNAAHTINVYGVSGATPATGTYNLIHANAAASSLNPATAPTLGTVFNNTNFTVGSFVRSATDLQLSITAAAPLATAYWTGGLTGVTNVWAASNGTAASNWVTAAGGGATGLVPGVAADVNISANTVSTAPTATVLGANMAIRTLTISDTTNGLGIKADGYTLTITPTTSTTGITVSASVPASNIGANIALGANQTWTNNSTNTLTVSGGVSGGYALTKAGSGVIALTNSNGYTGGTTISAGTLNVQNGSALGAGAVNFTTLAGQLQLQGGVNLSNTITMSGTSASGGFIGNAGGVNTLSGSIVNAANGAMYFQSDAGTLNLTGGLNTGAHTVYYQGSGDISITTAASYYNLFKTGSGTLLLGGANTFSSATNGQTNIQGGTLKVNDANALTNSSSVNISGGAKLDLNGFNQTIKGLNGVAGAFVDNSSATTSTLTVNNTVANTFAGVIQNTVGILNLTKTGAGLLNLTGANTYSGTTTLRSTGTISLGSAETPGVSGPLGNGGTITFSGGYLQYTASNTYDYSSRFSTAGSQTIGVDTNGKNITWASNFSNSTATTLTKIGTGTLTLSGSNTFKTVNLNSNSTIDIGAGTLNISDGSGGGTGLAASAGGIINATGGGVILFSGGNGTNGMNNFSNAGTTLTVNAKVTSVNSVSFEIFGGSGTIYLANNANDFAGNLNIGQGILRVDTIGNQGSTTSALGQGTTINLGGTNVGTLLYTGTGETSDRIVALVNTSGGVIDQSGAGLLKFTSDLSVTGASAARPLTLQGSTAGTGEIAGIISNGTGNNTTSVTKAGTGTWTLSANNTMTGMVTLDNGTLVYSQDQTTPVAGLTFGASAGNTNISTLDLTNASLTATQLLVQTNTTTANTITVGAGKTLTIVNSLTMGYSNSSSITTQSNLTIGGPGSLAITGTRVQIGVSQSTQNGNNRDFATLDLRTLGSFSANVTTFNVGQGNTSQGTLYLSDTGNTILATTLTVGDSNGNNGAGNNYLYLGKGTNVLQADTINIGRCKNSAAGYVQFISSTGPGTVVITDKAGTGGANIDIANNNGTGTANGAIGTLDLRGHSATVTADVLTIGNLNQSSSGGTSGTLYFDTGTFTVNSIYMAPKSSSGIGAANATMNIGGGAFTVNSGGSFTLASQTGGGSANGTLNITGGVFTSNVNILDGGGTATSTITLNGGLLDMTGHNIGDGTNIIDAVNIQSGTLQNVGQINGGTTALTKSTTGTLTLNGNNTYTGSTVINGGTLALGAAGSLASPTIVVGDAGSTGAVLDVSAKSGGWTVASGQRLMGKGTIHGTTILGSGAISAPGNSVDTQTFDALTLGSGSILEAEFNNTPANDKWIVTNSDGLTINGGAFKLFNEGTTDTFSTAGTYQLIQYNGAIGGSIGLLSVDPSTKLGTKAYHFFADGTWVGLVIADKTPSVLSLSNSTVHLNMLKGGTIDLAAAVTNNCGIWTGDDMAYTLTGAITGSGTLSNVWPGEGATVTGAYSQAAYGSYSLSVTANATNVNLGGAATQSPASFSMTIIAGNATAGDGVFVDANALYSNVANTGSYANLASKVTDGPVGKLGSEAIITAGTAGADRLVSMNWRTRTADESDMNKNNHHAIMPADAYNLVSDVVALAGTGGDSLTLKVFYDPGQLTAGYSEAYLAGDNKYSQQWIYLAELVGGTWTKVAGSQTVDTVNHSVLATVTHDGTYAVVPEPGTMALLLVGGVGVLLRRRRKA